MAGLLSGLQKEKSAEVVQDAVPPTPAPVAAEGEVEGVVQPAVAAKSSDAAGFDGDLKSFEAAKAPTESPAAATVADGQAARSASTASSLTEQVRQRLEESTAAATPPAEPEAEATSTETAVAAPNVLEGALDAFPPMDAAAPEGAEGDGSAPQVDIVYNRSNAAAIVQQLLNGANLPLSEAVSMTQDWVNAIGDEIRPRAEKLSQRQLMLQEEEQRIREREAAAQAAGGGGGGVLTSLLGRLLASDPRSRHNRAIQNFKGDRDALVKTQNDLAERFRERIYTVKARQLPEKLLDVQAGANSLSRAIRMYNEAFLKSGPAEGFAKSLKAYAAKEGISIDDALDRIKSGRASELKETLHAIRSQVIIDDRVVAAREEMEDAERKLAASFNDAVRDTELMARNFPDKFDAAKAQEEMTAAAEEMVRLMPDPIAEEEGKKKLRERMKAFAESIRSSFEAIVNRVLASVGASPKA